MWAAPTDAGGVLVETKTAGSHGRILVALGSSHLPKLLPRPAVFSDPRDHTERGEINNYLQYGSGKHGPTLVITDSGGRISCS